MLTRPSNFVHNQSRAVKRKRRGKEGRSEGGREEKTDRGRRRERRKEKGRDEERRRENER